MGLGARRGGAAFPAMNAGGHGEARGILPRRRPLWQAAVGLLCAAGLVAPGAGLATPSPSGPPAGSTSAAGLSAAALGLSPCELLRGLPSTAHPLRTRGIFAAAFRAQEAAGRAPERQGPVLRAFRQARDTLLSEAARAFRTEADGETGFDPSRAERLLATRVLVPNGPLRIGRDGFELAPEALAGLALAACRAGDLPQVLAAARATSGPEGAALRVSAVVVALFSGASQQGSGSPDAIEALSDLTRDLAPSDFMSAFALTELALRRAAGSEARALHARARAFVTTDDEHEAWRRQEQRL